MRTSKIKESTRQRCRVIPIDDKLRSRLLPVSLELFHFFYEVREMPFSIYCRVDDEVVEYVSQGRRNKSHLDDLWELMRRPDTDCEICIRRADRSIFEQLIAQVRADKMAKLSRTNPDLDRKTLDIYAQLSVASQAIVAGGIGKEVAEHVKACAAYLVSNAFDSDLMVSTLSRMITCDPTLYDHSASVAMIATVIGLRLLPNKLSSKETELVAQCALYHDVGKTCVPHEILNKPGKFTPAEFEIMKQHSVLGYKEITDLIGNGVSIDGMVARVALEHHEKFDGRGYPHGRRGRLETDPEQGIHLYTRIVSIADVYSALLMKRVYKPAFAPQDAIRIMAQEVSSFDPQIILPFIKCVVRSLNKDDKSGQRLLVLNEDGTLNEWNTVAKTA